MSPTDRTKAIDLTGDTPPRPRIWVEGRQQPRFNLAAFGTTALGMAKRDLAPEIVDAVQRLDHLGQALLRGEGRVNLVWAGRAARLVPSAPRVGAWVLVLRGVMQGAHDILVPAPPPPEDLAYPDLARRPAPTRPRPKEEPTLHAIRSAIQSSPHDFGLETRAQPESDPAPKTTQTGLIRETLGRGAAWAALGVMMGFALPAGAIRALMFHLNGGDLSDWS